MIIYIYAIACCSVWGNSEPTQQIWVRSGFIMPSRTSSNSETLKFSRNQQRGGSSMQFHVGMSISDHLSSIQLLLIFLSVAICPLEAWLLNIAMAAMEIHR